MSIAMYIVYFAVLLLLPLYAQRKVMKTYKRYAEVRSTSGMTGAEVARTILDSNGLSNVRVVETPGVLSDHYDPRSKTVALSSQNYHNASVAGTSVAAHECGHAIQHKEAYAFLTLRSKLVPAANISSNLSWIFIMIGMLSSSMRSLMLIGIILLAIGVLFQIVTLPVEFDASKRALNQVVSLGIIRNEEESHARKVLSAAALTYVAAAATAVMELARLLLIYTGLNNNED
ncbi:MULTISPECIES: zinc metallopeptidase [unclassified Rummeliibacillus]|uniref:zinc metallopeptidase n=1 Tax=unclassified Rummeliibacillus TaxID=2622809 RepID=UPI0026882DBE